MKESLWVAAMALIALRPSASAQNSDLSRAEWFHLGVGRSGPTITKSNLPVPNINVGYNVGRGSSYYHIGLDAINTLTLIEPPGVFAISAGVGRRHVGAFHLVGVSAGPTLVVGKWTDGYRTGTDGSLELDSYSVVAPGVALEAQLVAKPLGPLVPEMGAGVELFANVNTHRPFYGLRVVLHGGNGR